VLHQDHPATARFKRGLLDDPIPAQGHARERQWSERLLMPATKPVVGCQLPLSGVGCPLGGARGGGGRTPHTPHTQHVCSGPLPSPTTPLNNSELLQTPKAYTALNNERKPHSPTSSLKDCRARLQLSAQHCVCRYGVLLQHMPSVQRKSKSGHAETNRWTTILQSWITTYICMHVHML
jgi:hypothetical protein